MSTIPTNCDTHTVQSAPASSQSSTSKEERSKVKWIWLSVGTAAIALGACGARLPADITLANAGFEEPVPRIGIIPGWIVSQHAGPLSYEMVVDDQVHAEGHASFRIKRVRAQVYGRIAQRVPIHNLDGKTVEISAMLKTEEVGNKGIVVQLTQEGRTTERATTDPVTGTQDFKQVTVQMKIAPGASELEVAATLRDAGTAWLDDVRVRVIDP
jgi:hypothetical protein